MQQFNEFIKEICTTAGIDPVEPDDAGGCYFLIDDLELSIFYLEPNRVIVCVPLADLSQKMHTLLLEQLLAFNYLYAGGGGATIAVNPEEQSAVMQNCLSLADFSTEQLLECVDHFLALARQWKTLIEQFNPQDCPDGYTQPPRTETVSDFSMNSWIPI